jgi:hypothetical protein
MAGGFFQDNLTSDSDLLEEQARDAADRAESARDRAELANTNTQSALQSANESAAAAAVSAQNASDSEQNAASSAQTASTDAATATSAISTTQAARDAAIGARDTSIAQAAAASASAATALGYKNDTQAIKEATQDLLDAFGDQYLGSFASAPTVDNSGNELTEGDIYWDETNNLLKFWDGSSWVSPETIASNFATNAQDSAAAALVSENNAAATLASALKIAQNLADLDNAATARTNLGLGTAATTAASDYATASQGTKADTAHAWGDHSVAGYLAATAWTGSPAYGIASADITNWNTAYGWGDHAAAGYVVASNNLSDVDAATARTNLDVDQAGSALAFAIALG